MKVYESGNFNEGHSAYERPGKRVLVGKRFSYAGCEWMVPAVYCCKNRLIVDVVKLIPGEALAHFAGRWYERLKEDPAGEGLTKEERLLAEAENPLRSFPSFQVSINGKKAESRGWCGTGWQRVWKQEGLYAYQNEAQELEEAYGLSGEAGWYCHRVRFLWPDGKREAVRELSLTVKAGREEYPCGCRFTAGPGCGAFEETFRHPAAGTVHRIRILSCEARALPEHTFHGHPGMGGQRMVFPRSYQALRYTVDPELSGGDVLRVLDADDADSPAAEAGGENTGVAAVGVILTGSPHACHPGSGDGASVREAASALHFEPVSETNWYISVSVQPYEPETVDMLIEVDKDDEDKRNAASRRSRD